MISEIIDGFINKSFIKKGLNCGSEQKMIVLQHSAMQVYDTLLLPVWLFSTETLEILASNQAAQTWLGFDAETFKAMKIVDLQPAEERAEVIDKVRRFVEAPIDAGTWTIVAKSGSRCTASFSWTKIIFDGTEAIVVSVSDIRCLNVAKGKSVEAARQKRFTYQLAPIGHWHVGLGQQFVEWDAETANIHDEPEGTSPTVEDAFKYYIPEHREQIRTVFEGCAEHGHSYDVVLQILTAKGRRVWVRSIGEAVLNEVGQTIAVEGAVLDISQHFATGTSTEAVSERLRNTLDEISDGFLLIDYDWQCLFVNITAEKLLRHSKLELLGKNLLQLVPEIGDNFRKQYQRAFSTGQTVQFEEFSIRSHAWLSVRAYPTPEGLAVYFHDITEHRARDEELRLLQAAVNHQNDIVIISNATPNNEIVYVNKAFETLTGYSRLEVVGKNSCFMQGNNSNPTAINQLRCAIEKQQSVQVDILNYAKSGQEYWLAINLAPITNEVGLVTHFVAVERDITKLKKVEQALNLSEQRYRLLSQASEKAIWEFDIVNNSQWVSDDSKEIFGHELDCVEYPLTTWWKHVHPDDEAPSVEAFNRLVSGEADTFYIKYRLQRADESWASIESRAFVLRDDDGVPIRILGSVTDISQRLELEERLHQAQKMEAVGQLTGGVAHDFNNLLTVMMGNAEILVDNLSDKPDLQILAEMSLSAADKGAELISSLLSFASKQKLQPELLKLGPLIQGMENLLRLTLPEIITFKTIYVGDLWMIEVDPSQIESALLNLTLNARDAMPNGGSLIIETSNASLDDDYAAQELDVKSGQYVLIEVTDTGNGISPDAVGNIFDPFFTTKEAGSGSGLGLSMIYGFIRQSGGHIRVSSKQGEGTTFRLYLPRSQASSAPIQFDTIGPQIIGGNEMILVVDDNSLVRNFVVEQLKSLGYRTFGVLYGLDALVLLDQNPLIDLLFTDVVMPGGMGGRELADAARALRPDLKVLFTSGYTENSIDHNGRIDSSFELLSKPYRRDQLAAKIRKVLDETH